MNNVLYIDDEQVNLKLFQANFSTVYNVHLAENTEEAYNIIKQNNIKVAIADQRMPDEMGLDFIERVKNEFPEVVFMILSAYSDFDIAKQAIATNRVYRFLLKPWNADELKMDIDNAIERFNFLKSNENLVKDLEIQNAELEILKQKLEDENMYLKEEIRCTKNFENIISEDVEFIKILKNIEQIGNSDASVMVFGETGTGKELIARAIHNLSNRRKGSFISVNCAAIPDTLFESELFGHEKGAFTGATAQRKGKFELANEGTIFLDEIGEIPLPLQSKLLRVLQENEIERIGGNKVLKLDIRVIAATNRNLQSEIEKNNFRSDLYYRINVFPIVLPPLRNRKKDIPLLVNYFIKKFNMKYGKKIKSVTKKSIQKLMHYSWPGNVRELENVVERAIITCHTTNLNIENIILYQIEQENKELKTLQELEREYIIKVLEKTNWKVGGDYGAAKILGLNRTTLVERLKKLNISKEI